MAPSTSAILANPHSSGPAAERTLRLVEEAKKSILDHFQAHPGRFASLPTNSSLNQDFFHPGYDILFTSGTTHSLRIVAEQFPWTSHSTLLYPHNAHTSVVGMRGTVLQKGATFLCKHLREIAQQTPILDANEPSQNLLLLPLECNFGGTRLDPTTLLQTLRNRKSKRKWYSMLDLAKAATTSPINLKQLDPDFAAISFYKMFGAPRILARTVQ